MPNYSFNGTVLPFVETVAAPYSSRVGSASTPGRSGSYAGRQYAESRKISVIGVLQATSYDALQDALSSLQASHDVSSPQQLIIRNGWYYLATVESFSDDEREVGYIRYGATYFLADPYAFSTTLSAPVISSSGGTFVVSGNRPAKPTISITVSAAPASSTVVLTNTTTGQSMTIAPDSTGTYTIDSLMETVKIGTTNKMGTLISGSFLSLAVGSNTITIATTGGATVSSASVSYRARAI